MDLVASRLAQHSMRLVDGESCFASCADNMAALGVAKGASTDDVDGGVATWYVYVPIFRYCLVCRRVQWRGQAGGRLRHPGAARLTPEQRRHGIFSGRLRLISCDALEAETRSALRVPACAPGPAPAIWATQVAYVVHPGCLTAVALRRLSVIPLYAPDEGGVLRRERGAVVCDKKLFSCGFLCCTIHNMCHVGPQPYASQNDVS